MPATTSHWRLRAQRTIREVTDKCRTDGVTDPKAILAQVDAAYPFGIRKHHPYTTWLDERRKLKRRLGIFTGTAKKSPAPLLGE